MTCLTTFEKFVISGSSDKTVKIWDSETGLCIKTLRGGHKATISCLATAQNGQIIISGSLDNTLCIWNLKKDIYKKLNGHTDSVLDVITLQNKNGEIVIVSVSHDQTLKIWNINGECLQTIQTDKKRLLPWKIAALPNGQIISGYENTLSIWDVTTGKILQTLNTKNNIGKEIANIIVLQNDQVIIQYRDALQVWNLNTRKIKNFSSSSIVFQTEEEKIFMPLPVIVMPNGEMIEVSLDKNDMFQTLNTKIHQLIENKENYNLSFWKEHEKKILATTGLVLAKIAFGCNIL